MMGASKMEALPQVESLSLEDIVELQAILKACHLSSEDVEVPINSFIGIRDGGQVIAVGGLEMASPDALLRSVAVAPEYRGQGLANLIVGALIKIAVRSHITSQYLLTETAPWFFEKLGFELVIRNDVPESIRSCRQFTGLCPDSADCLRLKISQ
ncbi:MAG: amino-acid N-acetyltransferase [Gammaproteobacteria bacterium]|jgi:amino-acid N-acetyltransferase